MSNNKGLRAALKKRIVNETEYRIPVVPLAEAQRIRGELQTAQQTVQAGDYLRAKVDGNIPEEEINRAIASAREAVEKLQAELDACFYSVRFRPLPAEDFDALVQLHPPAEEAVAAAREAGEEPELWNEETFYPELLERCAVNSELSAAEWVEELRGWSRAERKEIQARALEANVRSYSTALSFG